MSLYKTVPSAGLTEHGVYKIRSAQNDQWVNLSGSNMNNGTAIIAYGTQNNLWNDHWIMASYADGNGIKIAVNHGDEKPIDEDVGGSQTCLYQSHGGPNQRWQLRPVAFRIKNAATGRDLKTNGNGKTQTTVERNKEDKSTWWTFKEHGTVNLDAVPAPPEIVYVYDPAPEPIIIYDPPVITYVYD